MNVDNHMECENLDDAWKSPVLHTLRRNGDRMADQSGFQEGRMFDVCGECAKAVIEFADEDPLTATGDTPLAAEPCQTRNHRPAPHMAKEVKLARFEVVQLHGNAWKQVRGSLANEDVKGSEYGRSYGEACCMQPRLEDSILLGVLPHTFDIREQLFTGHLHSPSH